MRDILIISGSGKTVSHKQIDRVKSYKGLKIFDIRDFVGDLTDGDLNLVIKKAVDVIRKENIKKLVLIGGETAFNVLKKLKINFLEVVGSVSEGIALCKNVALRKNSDYKIILKPGGFGDKEILKKCIRTLENSGKSCSCRR